MIGFLFSVIAGAAMSIQGVMNTRLQERVGLWEANAYVQGTAFALSLVVMWLFGTGNLGALASAPRGYLLGGALGAGDHRYGHAGHQGTGCHGGGVGHPDRAAVGGSAHRRLWLDGPGKGAHGGAAVCGPCADAGGRGAVQVSLTVASAPSSMAVVMSLSWLTASLREVRVSLTCWPLASLAS